MPEVTSNALLMRLPSEPSGVNTMYMGERDKMPKSGD